MKGVFMRYTTIPTTDIKISPITVGCMSFGKDVLGQKWSLNPEETEAMVKLSLDLGLNFFDTANQYGDGTSEEYLGRALKKFVARDQVAIASKVYFNDGKLSKDAIAREIDGSLKRLGTDYLDLYIIHRFDYETSVEETLEALHNLVKAGKVRALGASSMFAFQFHTMQHVAERNGWTQFVAMENHYNLLYREEEREMIPLCKQQGVMLMPYSPLAGGRLARVNWQEKTKRSEIDTIAKRKYDSTEEQDLPIVQRVAALAQTHEVTMSQIALAWQWAKGITAPIVGATKSSHIEDAVKALDVKLTGEEITYLDELYLPHKMMGPIPVPTDK